jgi:hypothetical protein
VPIELFNAEIVSFGKVLNCISAEITGDDYIKCEEFSFLMWANKKEKGFYNNGIAATNNDPELPERTGLLGEAALGYYLGITPNLVYKEKGERTDFRYQDKSVDIKTSIKRHFSDTSLIRIINDKGQYIPLKSDIYIAAFKQNEDREKKSAEIVLVGGETKTNILLTYPIRSAKRGTHFNYELNYYQLTPIGQIFE